MKTKIRNLAAVSLLAIAISSVPTVSLAQEDFSPSAWAAEKIAVSARSGIIPEGFEAKPYNESISRGDFFELAVNTCRLYGIVLPKLPENHPFTDTQEPAVEYAYLLGLTQGTAPGIFSPDKPLTREMAAVVLSRIRLLIENTTSRRTEKPDRGYSDERGSSDSEDTSAGEDNSGSTSGPIYRTKEGVMAYIPPMDEQQAVMVLKEHSADSKQVSKYARPDMADMYSRGLIAGTGGGLLEPKSEITREQAALLSLNVLAYCDSSRIIAEDIDGCVIPAPSAIDISSSYSRHNAYLSWHQAASAAAYDITVFSNGVKVYNSLIQDNHIDLRSNSLYDSIFGGENRLIHVTLQVVPVDSEGRLSIFKMKKDFTITPWKNLNELITGDPAKSQFADISEAEQNMTSIKIRVWNLTASGTKETVTKSLKVNKNVAEDVKKIFDDIYNGKERFPIKSVSGYAYRDGKSQHSNGTAIDINPNENYFLLSSGRISAGSLWKPGVNPYSIKPGGDVVRAFNKYGWHWSPDMKWPNGKDYMHFSLLGK